MCRRKRGYKAPGFPRSLLLIFPAFLFLAGCAGFKASYSPGKKFSPEQLQKDYSLFRNILEESHPGLYWYTPVDSMNIFFEQGSAQLKDSLTEPEFRNILTRIVAKMNCGHTVTRPSKSYSRHSDTLRRKAFPLSIKIWHDTATVAANLHRRDSILFRGSVVKTIDNIPIHQIADSLFSFISSDGYNFTHKYQVLSNRGNFGSLYSTAFGSKDKYLVGFLDSSGKPNSVLVPVYDPAKDSLARIARGRRPSQPRRERRSRIKEFARSLRIDTANSTAFIDLNSFSKGYGLKSFFRSSFKTLDKEGIKFLVIDVRANGGGNVSNSTSLTKYIARQKFKLADSLYAINRNSRYKKHIKQYFFNRLFMVFTTKKKGGRYHFGYYERHYFKPKKNRHFDGTVFILTGGNSFSATTLFTQSVKDQENVIVVGEETGGAAYGNTAWLIPEATLPETRVQFRLPLFRLVIDRNIPKDGRGVQPEIEVVPTVNAIRRGADYKMEKTLELIHEMSGNKKF